MIKMYSKLFSFLITLFAFISIVTISASALTWDGSSSGGGGGGSPAGANGYAVRTTGDNCLGYRFSVVDKNANTKNGIVIDVFRNTSYGNLGYSSGYKFSTKYNKKQLITNQNTSFSTGLITTGCIKETSMGFAAVLPVPSSMGTWQVNYNNLNPVLYNLGISGGVGALVNGDKVLVEPLYDVRLQSVYHSVTTTELALYGKWLLGASSDGGSSSVSSSWGFISAYTNMHYPNSLFTPDGKGLWTAASTLSARATFYNIINKGYGVGIAYTETKPDFSPTLSVNICESWLGAKADRSYYFGNSNGSAFGNFTVSKGYPVMGNSVWFAVNFLAETQIVKVRQYVRHGGNWITRDVNLSSTDSNSKWFDVIFTGSEGGGSQATNLVSADSSNYIIEAKQDYIDSTGKVLKAGAIKTFYIPIKPKINRYQMTMDDILFNEVANNGTAGLYGSVYVGQSVYSRYTYTSDNTWTSYNNLRGATYAWTNNAWKTVYSLKSGSDLYIDNQDISIDYPFDRLSDIGFYTVPDNSANTDGGNRIKFKLDTSWVSGLANTAETTWIDIPIIKADVELTEIRLIDQSGYYVSSSQVAVGQTVTPQYVYKNNTGCRIYVEGFNNSGQKIALYLIPAYSMINVNGPAVQIPNLTTFSIWGGVYLQNAGIYNTAWESNGTNNTKTATFAVAPPLSIELITPNSGYMENTEVITSYKVINSSSTAYYPTGNVSIKFSVYKGSNVFYSYTKSNIVIPASGENLAYFRWTVPSGMSLTDVTMSAEILVDGASKMVKVDQNAVIGPNSSTTEDTRFEKSAPSDFAKVSPPIGSSILSSSWNEWVYEGGTLVKKNYGLNSSNSTHFNTPDVNSPSRKYSGGVWYMGSGYGFTTSLSLILSTLNGTLTPSTSAYTNAQTASLYFPEFKYSTLTSKYCSLNKIGANAFDLPNNSVAPGNARLHYVPLWFPDGNYTTQAYVSDIWTPAGMMSGYFLSNNIIILESAYDDWYNNVGHVPN